MFPHLQFALRGRKPKAQPQGRGEICATASDACNFGWRPMTNGELAYWVPRLSFLMPSHA